MRENWEMVTFTPCSVYNHALAHKAIYTDLFIAEYRPGAALKRQFPTVPAQHAVLVV